MRWEEGKVKKEVKWEEEGEGRRGEVKWEEGR